MSGARCSKLLLKARNSWEAPLAIPQTPSYLGFGLYVQAMTAFLQSPGTQPPLAVAIEGEWGSGKSSFMLQLEQQLRRRARDRVPVVRFNARRYDKQEEMWAAFALAVMECLRSDATWLRRW